MKRLWMLLFVLVGCASPTQPQSTTATEVYQIRFVKQTDTVFVDVSGKQLTETQKTKHIGAVTNASRKRMVLFTSDIYVKVSAGYGHIDTVSTVNKTSYPDGRGYVGNVFGAFPSMVGMTATIVATVVDDIRTPEEFRYPHLRKVLAVDTMRVVILPQR